MLFTQSKMSILQFKSVKFIYLISQGSACALHTHFMDIVCQLNLLCLLLVQNILNTATNESSKMQILDTNG